jgi:pentatricopeptide repeat protein
MILILFIISACSILRDEKRGMAIHDQLSDIQNVHLQNALIDFYGRINRIKIAEKIFDEMNLRETSSFNSLMKAFLVNDMPVKVLELFEQMKEKTIGPLSFKPDLITFMAVCDACEKLGLLNSPESSYGEFNWKKIFSNRISNDV